MTISRNARHPHTRRHKRRSTSRERVAGRIVRPGLRSATMPREKQRTPELRDRVLHAAVAMLADEGLAGFTTRKVANGASTSIPAVYELFGDKAGLVREILFEGFRRLHAQLSRLEPTDDPQADLEIGRASCRERV